MVDDSLDDQAWRAHLFRTRSEEQITAWARSLRHFRFCRGRPSPFLTEPDRLLVVLRWSDATDRTSLFDALGLTEGPDGWQEIDGVRVRVETRPGRLSLGVSGAEHRRTQVTDRDVESALLVERHLDAVDALADRIVDPPVDDRSCISPVHYPVLFAGGT